MGAGCPTRSARRAALLLLLLTPLLASAGRLSTQEKKALALKYWEQAESMREALKAGPAQPAKKDYQDLLAQYRKVYYVSPISPKANAAVARAAEVLADMGRVTGEEKYFQYAIRQYEFLFREYPGSAHRFEGQYAIGQMYQHDLKQPEEARAAYQEFLRRWPRHPLADDVKKALAALDAGPPQPSEAPAEAASAQPPAVERKVVEAEATQEPRSDPPPEAAQTEEKPAPGDPMMITGIRHWTTAGYARVALDIGGEVKWDVGQVPNPERIFFDLKDTILARKLVNASIKVEGNSGLKQVRLGQYTRDTSRIVLEVDKGTEYSAFVLPNPYRLIIDVRTVSEEPLEVRAAKPGSNGEHSLIRALGLKIGRIVVDPGHGGHDTGTIGPKGLLEKDLVLDVGKRLGMLLEERLGAEVIYTREDDRFVPLEARTALANRSKADLFISLHANASRDRSIRGVETYYLNFTSSADALEVAARENAVSERSISELQDLVKKITLKEKIDESREFAAEVQKALHRGMARSNRGLRDRGVKQAPFVVLIGAHMPSILAEISFLTNPVDERNLRGDDYRQAIAESLYRGVQNYIQGLSGIKVASKTE